MSFPSKEERQKCWRARDLYWNCLDRTNEDNNKCKDLMDSFQKNCSKKWFEHFEGKRVHARIQELAESGAFDNVEGENAKT